MNFNRISFALAALSLAATPALAQRTMPVQSLGSRNLMLSALAAGPYNYTSLDQEIRNEPGNDLAAFKAGLGGVSRVPASGVPFPTSNLFAGSNPGLFSFDGLTHRDQRLAGGGNQFSLEPPDQGLAVGGGFVVEAINTALAVYDTSGNLLLGPVTLSSFFGLSPEVIRGSSPIFGPFVSDPRVYYDAATQRFFVTLLELDVNPATGAFSGRSHLLFAVSQTSDPTASWFLYSIDCTDDGAFGTPSHANSPCFGDQPLVGADANGFYLSTNEFSLFTRGFNGAQIYAMSKSQLESGTLGQVVQFSGAPLAEGISYSVQPATVPPGGSFESGAGGTEYFLSALDFTGTLDNRIAVWALTNTSSLNTATPALTLTSSILTSQVYGQPPVAVQEDGFRPLAQFWLAQFFGVATPPVEKDPLINTNDDRMQQVEFANGKLWAGVNTVLKPSNGPTSTGISWFEVTPSVASGSASGTMTNQGYVSVCNGALFYPSLGMNSAGKGVMTFTMSSANSFPSAAYTLISDSGTGTVHVSPAGAFPDDGFTGYSFLDRPSRGVGRWGDYSAASSDEWGNIWFATEYIPNKPRTLIANWGTSIGTLAP